MTCRYCQRQAKARGMCMAHYKRWSRRVPINDQPIIKRRRYKDEERRLAVAWAITIGTRFIAKATGIPLKTIQTWVTKAKRPK